MKDFDLLAALRQLQKNTIQLETAGEKGVPAGHFGGLPDVPPDFDWPVFETETFLDNEIRPRPLSFLAQFDCAALASLDTEGLLPHTGILSFFYEMDSQRWGYSPKDSGCARTYWFPDTSVLKPANFPENLEEYSRFPEIRFFADNKNTYPDFADFSLAYPDITHPAYWDQIQNGWDDFCEEYEQAAKTLRGEERLPGHRLLGWPTIIQNNMTCECELVSRGHYLGNRWKDIPKADIKAANQTSLTSWQLLFQLDSMEAEDFCLDFGDCGSIYFYIRTDDLAARRFDRVWLVQQCY